MCFKQSSFKKKKLSQIYNIEVNIQSRSYCFHTNSANLRLDQRTLGKKYCAVNKKKVVRITDESFHVPYSHFESL